MLESMTIFTKGGLILYQYTADPSLFGEVQNPVAFTRESLNSVLIQKILLDPSRGTTKSKSVHIEDRLSFAWTTDAEGRIYAAIHPDILFQGPRMYLQAWVRQLLEKTQQEYSLFAKAAEAEGNENTAFRPDPQLFDKTFQILLSQSKGQAPTVDTAGATEEASPSATPPQTESSSAPDSSSTTNKQTKKGKEKRNWRDDNAKVTDKAMAALDKSGQANEGTAEDAHARALAEARAAYLPQASELENELVGEDLTVDHDQDSSSWSSSVTGLLQHLTGNKVLTSADLEQPLEKMEELLISKNVAREIAHDLCESVETRLIGKRLNSMYRVQTAVQQAFESTLTQVLKNNVDLLHAIATKRGDKSLFSSKNKTPYVICVVGINGVGKSTSLAKLAYYLKGNGCSPLLVAGDTFRSGAVEQLRVHADCLEIPLFSQGYSKDPSAVAKAAIAHATNEQHDVVLIDTAGRMQNNVPLMKALGKLVAENQPDFVILVCEALVGHDGLNQFQMFQQALGRQRKVDGLILTKFDTVSEKVGAAITLTHETGVPIVFCGTGQKYHHLKKLNAPAVVHSLLQ